MSKHILSESITANANYPSDSGVNFGGGKGTLVVTGTFGSATAKLQCSADGSTWVDVGDNVSFTANGVGNFELFTDIGNPIKLRLNVAGGSSQSMKSYLYDNRY